jgi:hypothetical protein
MVFQALNLRNNVLIEFRLGNLLVSGVHIRQYNSQIIQKKIIDTCKEEEIGGS